MKTVAVDAMGGDHAPEAIPTSPAHDVSEAGTVKSLAKAKLQFPVLTEKFD